MSHSSPVLEHSEFIQSWSSKVFFFLNKEFLCVFSQFKPSLKVFLFSLQQEDPYRKKKLQEKKEGNLQNLNWNKNRTCRKNKKRGAAQVLRYVIFTVPLKC